MPTRSLEDAIGIAAEWFRMQSPTRSDADNTVGNVELLTRLRPGESVPDTLLYLINYAGDRGFAIVGAPMALDWDAIVKGDDIEMTAFMLEELASNKYFRSSYEKKLPDGTVILDSNVRNSETIYFNWAFNDLGFKLGRSFMPKFLKDSDAREDILNFMDGTVSESGYKQAPVIIIADLYATGATDKAGGHAFLADGYKEFGVYSNIMEGKPLLSKTLYLHCIWGDTRGGANGYYKYFPENDEIDKESSNFFDYKYFCRNSWIYGKFGTPN